MDRRERIHFFMVWLALGVAPLFIRPLWQPDEGRYAEIPREMLATGDWLTPHLNYVLYFEKPPLQYWLSAISMWLFGESAAAARLPLALAAFLTMYSAWLLARRLGAERPFIASFAAASCLLLYCCGQILTLDALFASLCAFSLAAAVEAVGLRFSGDEPKKAVGWTLALYVGMALAVLTKGPAAIVLVGGALFFGTAATYHAAMTSDGRLRSALLRTFFSPYGWLAFTALAVPWFLAVNAKNPGHAHFFFYTEHFERFTTHKHSRQGSSNAILDKLYFVPVVLAGAVPWLGTCLAGGRRAARFFLAGRRGPTLPEAQFGMWTVATLLAAFAWPLLFFSLSGSKLIPYVMPCMVPLLALAAAFGEEKGGYFQLWRTGTELLSFGAVCLITAAVVLFLPNAGGAGWAADLRAMQGGPWLLLLGLSFALLGTWGLRESGHSAPTQTRWMVWLCALLLLLSVAAQRVNGPNSTIDALVEQAPEGNVQWISHGNYFQALPFLTKSRVAVVGHTGELRYGKDRLNAADQRLWFSEERGDLTETATRLRIAVPDKPIWAISDVRAWEDLPPEAREAWEVEGGGGTTNAVLLRLR